MVLAILAVPMGPSSAAGVWSRPAKLTPPSDAGSDPDARLVAVSCTSAGNCTGTGQYVDIFGKPQAMVATETKGVWGAAEKVTAPSDADTNPEGILRGVSCTSAGNCTAVGDYQSVNGITGMAVTESAGIWSASTAVSPPANAGNTVLTILWSVSCTSPGNCTAAGQYVDKTPEQQAMAVPQSGGAWGAASEVTTPPDASTLQPHGMLSGISCTSIGNCVAVGQYISGTAGFQAMAATESAGTWGQAGTVSSPPDASSSGGGNLLGVACASAGNCTAAGTYVDPHGRNLAMAAAEAAGAWGEAVQVAAPSDAASNPSAQLNAVSCNSGTCTAGGQYLDTSFNTHAITATETGGAWSQGAVLASPSNAGSNPTAQLNGLSCTAAQACAAVGSYLDNFSHFEAMTTAERVSTKTALKSSADPVPHGVTVTYTATVTPNPGGGRVRFTDGGVVVPGCKKVSVVGATPASAVARCHITYAAAGTHSIQAAYRGTASSTPSKSKVLSEVVT